MTFVGAGAALDTCVEKHLQRAVLAGELSHLVDGNLLPVLDELTGKTKRLLVLRRRYVGLAVGHGALDHHRDLQEGFELGSLELGLGHD